MLDGRPTCQDTAIQPAVHALGGVKVFLTDHLAVFTEYEFMHTGELEFDLKRTSTVGGGPGLAAESSTVRAHLTSHLFYAGVRITGSRRGRREVAFQLGSFPRVLVGSW